MVDRGVPKPTTTAQQVDDDEAARMTRRRGDRRDRCRSLGRQMRSGRRGSPTVRVSPMRNRAADVNGTLRAARPGQPWRRRSRRGCRHSRRRSSPPSRSAPGSRDGNCTALAMPGRALLEQPLFGLVVQHPAGDRERGEDDQRAEQHGERKPGPPQPRLAITCTETVGRARRHARTVPRNVSRVPLGPTAIRVSSTRGPTESPDQSSPS